jgi:hypothetical protein
LDRTIYSLLYLTLIAGCVGVSVYTTHEGFSADFPSLSYVFAGLIGLGLLTADLGIRAARVAGGDWRKPALFLVLCMVASAASHFNFFYSRSVSDTLISDKVEEATKRYDQNVLAARSALEARNNATSTASAVRNAMKLLVEQIEDEGRPGYGFRADGLVLQIAAQMSDAGMPLGDFSRPAIGTPRSTALSWVSGQFETRVRPRLDELIAKDPVVDQLSRLQSENSELLIEQAAFSQAAKSQSRIQAGMNLIDQISSTSINMQTNVSQTLKNNGVDSGWKLPVNPVLASEARVGTIAYSFRTAVSEGRYQNVAILALGISILIDILPLCFVLLVPVRKSSEVDNGAQQLRPSRPPHPRLMSSRENRGYQDIRTRR